VRPKERVVLNQVMYGLPHLRLLNPLAEAAGVGGPAAAAPGQNAK